MTPGKARRNRRRKLEAARRPREPEVYYVRARAAVLRSCASIDVQIGDLIVHQGPIGYAEPGK